MKKILIASTYYENKKHPSMNKLWMRLQKEFFTKTTNDYDFSVYLQRITNREPYKDCIIIGENLYPSKHSRISHRAALTAIIEYFREKQSEYANFCILDSDCFPIRRGWVGDLRKAVFENDRKFAAIMRMENGETFPHPSAIFIPSQYIQENLFNFDYYNINEERPHYNILNGLEVRDTGSGCTFWDGNKLIGYPIIRSNIINVHPLFAGIYGDIFYHNGCGTRMVKNFRVQGYWEKNSKNFEHNKKKRISKLFESIKKSPQKFINYLRGDIKEEQFTQWFKPFNPQIKSS